MRALNTAPAPSHHAALRARIRAAAADERTQIADFVSVIAEYDELRLYVEEGYATMHAFCVEELNLCEDSAYKRIQAARAARRFPQLLPALADGRLHLSAVVLLAPHLSSENVDDLVEASTHQTNRAIRDLISRRLLGPVPGLDFDASQSSTTDPMRPVAGPEVAGAGSLDLDPVNQHFNEESQIQVGQPTVPSRRIDVHCTVDRELLEQARSLLSHSVPSGDLGQILDRALAAVIQEREKKKFAATARPNIRVPRQASTNARYVPAQVKREVWLRDEGQCTYVAQSGHRCGAKRFLEFDHVRPVALGGEATVDDVRLRCRAHNQFEAERVFGQEFMAEKRAAARRARAEAREAKAAFRAEARKPPQDDRVRAIASGLRNLGCRADEARYAAETAVAAAGPDTTLEDCLRAALRSLGAPRGTRREETKPVEAVPV